MRFALGSSYPCLRHVFVQRSVRRCISCLREISNYKRFREKGVLRSASYLPLHFLQVHGQLLRQHRVLRARNTRMHVRRQIQSGLEMCTQEAYLHCASLPPLCHLACNFPVRPLSCLCSAYATQNRVLVHGAMQFHMDSLSFSMFHMLLSFTCEGARGRGVELSKIIVISEDW